MDGISQLPTELWRIIAHNLQHKDILNLRLTCKRVCTRVSTAAPDWEILALCEESEECRHFGRLDIVCRVFPNLRTLGLCVQPQSLEPVASLDKLKVLIINLPFCLDGVPFKGYTRQHLEPLARLPSLHKLFLPYVPHSCLDIIGSLTTLTNLSILDPPEQNVQSDFSTLSSLVNMKALSLPYLTEDLAFLQPLTKLTRLNTTRASLSLDFQALSHLTNLEDLIVLGIDHYTGSSACLAHLTKLDTLEIEWDDKWVPLLNACTQLKYLTIHGAEDAISVSNNPSLVTIVGAECLEEMYTSLPLAYPNCVSLSIENPDIEDGALYSILYEIRNHMKQLKKLELTVVAEVLTGELRRDLLEELPEVACLEVQFVAGDLQFENGVDKTSIIRWSNEAATKFSSVSLYVEREVIQKDVKQLPIDCLDEISSLDESGSFKLFTVVFNR